MVATSRFFLDFLQPEIFEHALNLRHALHHCPQLANKRVGKLCHRELSPPIVQLGRKRTECHGKDDYRRASRSSLRRLLLSLCPQQNTKRRIDAGLLRVAHAL